MSRKASEASNDPRQLGPATRSRAGLSGTAPSRAAPKVEPATPDCNTHASSSSGSRKRKSGDDSANQTGPTITIAPNPEPVKQKAAAAGRRKPASNPALHEPISETVALPAAEALPESSAAAANQPKDEAKPRKAAPPQDWFEQLFGFVEGADGESTYPSPYFQPRAARVHSPGPHAPPVLLAYPARGSNPALTARMRGTRR